MIIHIPRSEPISTDESLYLCNDAGAYMHISKIQISDDNPHAAELSLLERINTGHARLVEDVTVSGDFLPLGIRAGLAICQLSEDAQTVFWQEMERFINDFIKTKRFHNPEAAKSALVIILPGTMFRHTEDKSDELYAYLCRDEDGKTKVGFDSMFNFGGATGPELVLLRNTP